MVKKPLALIRIYCLHLEGGIEMFMILGYVGAFVGRKSE